LQDAIDVAVVEDFWLLRAGCRAPVLWNLDVVAVRRSRRASPRGDPGAEPPRWWAAAGGWTSACWSLRAGAWCGLRLCGVAWRLAEWWPGGWRRAGGWWTAVVRGAAVRVPGGDVEWWAAAVGVVEIGSGRVGARQPASQLGFQVFGLGYFLFGLLKCHGLKFRFLG